MSVEPDFPVRVAVAGEVVDVDVEDGIVAAVPAPAGHVLRQGDDRFAVYRRSGRNAYVRSFRVGAAAGIDAVSDTDGVDVTARALGPRFPRGLFVAQDGDNDDANQNFKIVRWQR